jgi:hypothetical protein
VFSAVYTCFQLSLDTWTCFQALTRIFEPQHNIQQPFPTAFCQFWPPTTILNPQQLFSSITTCLQQITHIFCCLELPGLVFHAFSVFRPLSTVNNYFHDQRRRARDRVREGDERFQLTSRGMPSIFWTEILYLKLDEFSCFFDVKHCSNMNRTLRT